MRAAGLINFALPGFDPAFRQALNNALGPPGGYARALLGSDPPVLPLLIGVAKATVVPANVTSAGARRGQGARWPGVGRDEDTERGRLGRPGGLLDIEQHERVRGAVALGGQRRGTRREWGGRGDGPSLSELGRRGLGHDHRKRSVRLQWQRQPLVLRPCRDPALASAATGRATPRRSPATSRSRSRSDGRPHAQRPALPAGTYTITTSSATLSGSGTTSSPNFAGRPRSPRPTARSTSGPGREPSPSAASRSMPDDETTLDGYNGTISVSANGDGTDSVSLNGNAGNVLQVAASPATLTTDQNTPVTFATEHPDQPRRHLHLTANAPAGWTVAIDSNGNVTVDARAGAPGRNLSDPDHRAVADRPQPRGADDRRGDDHAHAARHHAHRRARPAFTVPFNGAQLPTAFRASIQNLGPAADTYNLTFANVPSGFTLLDSGDERDRPGRRRREFVGVYLVPNTGQALPPRARSFRSRSPRPARPIRRSPRPRP